MRILFRILFLFAALNLFAADEPAPPPQLPENLTLTSKVVLHKITAVRWEKDRVIIHHMGGTDPIQYKYIAESQRALMLALRDIEMAKAPLRPRPAAEALPAGPVEGTYSGLCYVSSDAAAGGFYKMPGVMVLVLPAEAESRFADDNATITLPKPLQAVPTDAEGRFAFAVPAKTDFYLVAQSYRLSGGQKVYYHWRMKSKDIKDPARILLTSENSSHVNKRLLFDKDP